MSKHRAMNMYQLNDRGGKAPRILGVGTRAREWSAYKDPYKVQA
jgi:hypothetical protein